MAHKGDDVLQGMWGRLKANYFSEESYLDLMRDAESHYSEMFCDMFM